MWLSIWSGGDSVTERPLCLLVHYLLGVNVLCLITAQGLAAFLVGADGPLSLTWIVATVVLILAHAAFALLFTWIDGEEVRFEGGTEGEIDVGGDGAGGDGSGGSSSG